ncbi:TetR/AcrR family transcriptional regulator [Nonomuraea sp. NPDC049480]|uniref:TetR/AcrR family transcriptional regulator n=1 Tax=Nonomuraea sp. NPDC049480 TaxID=3364353 RepID=UPI00379B27A8
MPRRRSALQPRKTPQQQRAWRTRERILQAAAHVFAEHGYASGTTDRIAEEAGLSIGSLYQYFPNKDAILLTLALAHVDDAARVVQEQLENARHLEEWLPRLTHALAALHASNPRVHRVLFEEAPRSPELLRRFHETEEQAVAAVAALLLADETVTVSQPEGAARFVVATIESLIHRFAGRNPPMKPAELADEIVLIVTRYLRG